MPRRISLALLSLAALTLAFPPAAAGGACHAGSDGRTTTSTDGEVAIADCEFTDTVTYVEPGDSVTWKSKDVFPHTVSGAALAWGDDHALQRGDEVTYRFDEEGVYPYYCALHPAMVGAVVVGDGVPSGRAATSGVEKVDLAAAPAVDEVTPDGRDGGGLIAAAGTSVAALLVAAALVIRLGLRRRAGASPAS